MDPQQHGFLSCSRCTCTQLALTASPRPPGGWRRLCLEHCGPRAEGGRESRATPHVLLKPFILFIVESVPPGQTHRALWWPPGRHPSWGSQQGADVGGAAQERTSAWLVGGRHWGVLCAASGPRSSGSCVSQRATPRGQSSGAVWGLEPEEGPGNHSLSPDTSLFSMKT